MYHFILSFFFPFCNLYLSSSSTCFILSFCSSHFCLFFLTFFSLFNYPIQGYPSTFPCFLLLLLFLPLRLIHLICSFSSSHLIFCMFLHLYLLSLSSFSPFFSLLFHRITCYLLSHFLPSLFSLSLIASVSHFPPLPLLFLCFHS